MGIKQKLERSMTVEQLIGNLRGADPDAVVVFVCDYGDYTHTQQALQIETMDVHTGTDFHDSAYSGSGIALNKEDLGPIDPEDEEEEEVDQELADLQVVVLQ